MARFDCATWRPIGANTGGTLAPNLGLVLHHAVADGSLWSFFNSPSAQVSAHFWVAQDGTVEQYVDTDVVAWHGKQLNTRYVGVETEGCGAPPHAEPMTDEMVAGLAAIYAEGHARYGWPFELADADGQPGFGYHRMAVNTACPCDTRLERRADILALAAGGQPAPIPPTLTAEDTTMVLTDPETGGVWVADATGAIFAYDRAPYLGGVNNPAANPGGYPCVGIATFIDTAGPGYLLVLDWGDTDGDGDSADGGDRYRRYRFSRDGTGRT